MRIMMTNLGIGSFERMISEKSDHGKKCTRHTKKCSTPPANKQVVHQMISIAPGPASQVLHHCPFPGKARHFIIIEVGEW